MALHCAENAESSLVAGKCSGVDLEAGHPSMEMESYNTWPSVSVLFS